MFAPFERLFDGCIVVHVHVGEVDRDSPDDREASFRLVGHAREGINRRDLDREHQPANTSDLGGEHEQIRGFRERWQRPREQQRKGESRRRIIVDVLHLHDFVLEPEQGAWVDVEREMQVDRTGAGLFRMEVDLPQLAERVRLDEMSLVVYVESVIDRLALQIGDESRYVNDCHTLDTTCGTLRSAVVIDPLLRRALETFLAAADAVAAVLAVNTDWGASGVRDGQYAVDLDADQACLDILYSAGYRVLSEESGVTGRPGSESSPIVVVDPLDGSTNASRRVPWFASAVCLVDDDGPAVGVVVNHATGERFTGIRGHGAERNGHPIRPTDAIQLEGSILGVSGLPSHHYGWAQFRALGASAPDICAVACGVTDAWCDMLDNGHGVWDYLASITILEAAGGVAVDVFERDLCVLDHAARRAPAVAATPQLLAAVLVERRRSSGSDPR